MPLKTVYVANPERVKEVASAVAARKMKGMLPEAEIDHYARVLARLGTLAVAASQLYALTRPAAVVTRDDLLALESVITRAITSLCPLVGITIEELEAIAIAEIDDAADAGSRK